MGLERWHAVAAAAALVSVGFIGFAKYGGSSPRTDASSAAAESPVRAPDDLLADLYAPSPNASWARLQRGVGGAMGMLPSTLPGVLVALTDLDARFADELDGTAPMYGVVAGDPTDPGVVFAMKLVDGRRARVALADGDTSRFATKEAPGMTLLVPNGGAAAGSWGVGSKLELAITPNGYLLVARHGADLARLGPYVTRTLPARPPSIDAAVAIEIPRSALQRVLVPKLESLWSDGKSFLLAEDARMRAERGRAPDFGDPAAIVAAVDAMLGRRVAILGDLEKLRVELEITEDAAVFTATLTPQAPEVGADAGAGLARRWVDGMKVGDAAPVLALPSVSTLALSMRDGEVDRDEQAKELEEVLTASLGPRLKDPSKLHDVIEAMSKARDESSAFALGLEEPAGLFVHAPVRDGASADKALHGAFELAQIDPFKELLRVRGVTASSEELPGLGKVAVAVAAREPRIDKNKKNEKIDNNVVDHKNGIRPASSSVGAAWATDRGTLTLGLGAEPLVTLRLGAKPERVLADEPSLKRFVAAIGSSATTVLVGQPLRLDPKRANLPTAPLGIAVGRKGGDAFVRVDIADALLREAARWQMGW